MNYLTQILSELKEFKGITILLLIALVGTSIFFAYTGKNKKNNTKVLVYGGLCIAMSFTLSYIKLYHWPQGGSITPGSMLPMFVFAFLFGPRVGIIAGIAYGILQFIQGPFIVHWAQVFIDYPIAFGAMGLAGLNRKYLPISVLIGGFGRFAASFLSGYIFFGCYAPEGMHPALYSLSVNLTVLGTETAICVVLSLIPQIKNAIKKLERDVSA